MGGRRVQIFYKEMKATVFDMGFDFPFLFPVSSWAKKDASVSVSARGDHLQGRPSAENWANSWLPWLHVCCPPISRCFTRRGSEEGLGLGVANRWGGSCTAWHIAAI